MGAVFSTLDVVHVSGDSDYFFIVTQAFNDLIAPVYGDQTSALDKIARGHDRECKLLRHGDESVGIVVYKTVLQNEARSSSDSGGALEAKTLLVLKDSIKYSGLYFATLLNIIAEAAIDRGAARIEATVSIERPKVLRLLQNFGFEQPSASSATGVGCVSVHPLVHRHPKKLYQDTRRYCSRDEN